MAKQHTAGVPMADSLENAADACGNAAIAQAAKMAAIRIRIGERTDAAIAACIRLPSFARQLLGTAQETGAYELLVDRLPFYAGLDNPSGSQENRRSWLASGDAPGRCSRDLEEVFGEWLPPVVLLATPAAVLYAVFKYAHLDMHRYLSPEQQVVALPLVLLMVTVAVAAFGIYIWQIVMTAHRIRYGQPL